MHSLRFKISFLAIIALQILVARCADAHLLNGIVPNAGQVIDENKSPHPEILFVHHAPGVTTYFCAERIISVLTTAASGVSGAASECRVDMEFLGATPHAAPHAENPTGAVANFYYPHCQNGITSVPAYQRIVFAGIYNNIDAVVELQGAHLKKYFIVHAGGKISDIKVQFTGAQNFADSGGTIYFDTPLGRNYFTHSICENAVPAENRVTSVSQGTLVQSTCAMNAGMMSFDVENFNPGATYQIQISIVWGKYLGGNVADLVHAIAVGRDGSSYVVGYTTSTNLPTSPGAFQPNKSGNADAFAARLDSAGNLLWCTYYGGSGVDVAIGCSLDSAGDVYLTGDASSDFPASAAAQQASFGGGIADGFLLKLSATGARKWCTFVGGSGYDGGVETAVDQNGNVAVTGLTVSSDFYFTNTGTQNHAGGGYDIWLAQFDSTGKENWATYFGGTGDERGRGIATDPQRNIIVTGMTTGANFTVTKNSFQPANHGGTDAYIAKFSSTGALLWSTMCGGAKDDAGCRVRTDDSSNIYVEGSTASNDFPVTANAFQKNYGGGNFDAFLAKFDSAGNRVWATYYGGSATEDSNDIPYFTGLAVSRAGSAVLTGRTSSNNLPGMSLSGSTFGGGAFDAFVTKFTPDGNVQWTTYLGSDSDDEGRGVAFDSSGDVIAAGSTDDPNFPGITNSTYAGGALDAFIVKLGNCTPFMPNIFSSTNSFLICAGDSLLLTSDSGYAQYVWSSGEQTQSIVVKKSGTYHLTAYTAQGCGGVSQDVTVTDAPAPQPTITLALGGPCANIVTLDAGAGYASYGWSAFDKNTGVTTKLNNTSQKISVSNPDTIIYTATVTNNLGCDGTAAITLAPQAQSSLAVDSLASFGSLEIGSVLVFADSCRSFTVRNPGNNSVTIDSSQWLVGDIFLLQSDPFPIVIAPGATANFSFCFSPTDSGAYNDTLDLEGNCLSLLVPMSGEGALRAPECGGEVLDLITYTMSVAAPFPNPAVDALDLNVQCKNGIPPDAHCVLIDELGRTIARGAFMHNAFHFDVQSLPAGMYSAAVSAGRQVFRFPVAVMR